ncbi:hypothetical protein GMRT_10072 [Giardia muris]|uniref:SH3 domain-containing protein n=1 Tax=Giardia muris TaxID=5742 RepID=A0A4Z1T607_GIAMU|nr:hypothetical protein GMRT_10072 [Giardia muris]|eukprot:TNJ27959.1 hypothetical protein GMRT_10072 [Giardia muris]
MSRHFVVEKSFQAEDPEHEFTAHRGDVFDEASHSDEETSPDWIYVRRPEETDAKFLPLSCLKELEDGVKDKYKRSRPEGSLQHSDGNGESLTSTSPIRPKGDPSPILPREEPTERGPEASLGQLFRSIMKQHEEYFTTVSQKREQSFKKLSGAVEEAQLELAKCKERNALIREQISDLDELISSERAKWQRLAGISPSAAQKTK